jgi:hypothetical protein
MCVPYCYWICQTLYETFPFRFHKYFKTIVAISVLKFLFKFITHSSTITLLCSPVTIIFFVIFLPWVIEISIQIFKIRLRRWS